MGNCNSSPFLQPGQIAVRKCVDNKPQDIIYANRAEFDKILANPFARQFMEGRTVWENNTSTLAPGVQVPFTLDQVISNGNNRVETQLSSEPLKPGTIAGGLINLNQVQNAPKPIPVDNIVQKPTVIESQRIEPTPLTDFRYSQLKNTEETRAHDEGVGAAVVLPSKMSVLNQTRQAGRVGERAEFLIDKPLHIRVTPKCNNTIEKFSPETCSNICNTLNDKLTTTNIVLLVIILLFIYYIFIMHRNPVKDIMSL